MDWPFPFGFPLPTAFYLTLYVVTLLIHVIFMNFVLAGSTYLFVATGMGSDACRVCVWQKLLVDWLPFATGLAITAGVAPLLFVQILYQQEFYSANLLLSHRWMAILPVLIGCFYLLYLLKTEWLFARGAWAVNLVRGGVFCGFAFIAWSWTENHLLSLDAAAWPGMYERGDLVYRSWRLPSRLAMWFLGAFPTLACELLWLGRWTPNLPAAADSSAVRRLGLTGCGGLFAAGVAAVAHVLSLPEATRQELFGPLAGPYVQIAGAGAVLQVWGWLPALRHGTTTPFTRLTITGGCLLTLLGMTVVREGFRLNLLADALRFDRHLHAAGVGGLLAFLVFFAINAVLILRVAIQIRRTVAARAAEGE